MSDCLSVCGHNIMFVIGKIDKIRFERPQDVLHKLYGFSWCSMVYNNLDYESFSYTIHRRN